MVRQHLIMIMPSRLKVYDDNLLDPEGELREVIELHRGSHIQLREVRPERYQKIRDTGFSGCGRVRKTGRGVLDEDANAPRPIYRVVEEEVALLGEPI